jgi:tetratricopeptide (TPR) repeat protein
MGRKDDAKRCFEQATEIEPEQEDVDQIINKAIAFFNLERYDEAIQLYKEASSIDPDNPRALVNLGNAYDRNGQYDKAIEVYDKAPK